MKKYSYKIEYYSNTLMAIIIFPSLIVGLFIALYLSSKGYNLALLVLFCIGIVFWRGDKASSAWVNIILDKDEGFIQTWANHFWLFKKNDLNIHWSEIESYIFQQDPMGTLFKLQLHNGTKYRFYHKKNTIDEFSQFEKGFKAQIKKYNNNVGEYGRVIIRGKTFYETTTGLLLGIFLAIVCVLGIIHAFTDTTGKALSKIGKLFVGIAYTIFFISQIYKHRKKRQ